MRNWLGLGDVYDATIERIKAQGGYESGLGMRALMWISHAEWPLSADGLCHALGIELDSADFNSDNIPSITTVVSCCQGLMVVDKGASYVRLIHFTLKEYFSAHPEIFGRPHSAMAEICLGYLNSPQVKALSRKSSADARDVVHDKPFLEYCSLYWAAHAKRELSDHLRSLALQLLQVYDGHISAQILLRHGISLGSEHPHTWSPFSGLHCASYLGFVEIVVALIDMRACDPNGTDFRGCTPLARAAWKGHKEVVKILLGREEVDPDTPDNEGRTPLSHAAENGHEEVVKILLKRKGVNPDTPDSHGRIPLSHAAGSGCEGVVNILLGREEVDPDKPDNDGRTPLY